MKLKLLLLLLLLLFCYINIKLLKLKFLIIYIYISFIKLNKREENKNESAIEGKENININWTKQSSVPIYANIEHIYNKYNDSNNIILNIFNAEQKTNTTPDRIDKDSLGISETNTFLKSQDIKNSYNLNNKQQLKVI